MQLLVLHGFVPILILKLVLSFWLAHWYGLDGFLFDFCLLKFFFGRDTKVSISVEESNELLGNFLVVLEKFSQLVSKLLHSQLVANVFVDDVVVALVNTARAFSAYQVVKLGTQLLLEIRLKVVTNRLLTISLATKRSGINSMKMLRNDSLGESTL